MTNENATSWAEPDYKTEYNILLDENRHLKESIEILHRTIVEMCICQYISRFYGKRGADNG